MRDPFSRGSAMGRARSSCQRPGSFKPGHKKLGGRKKGTPNRISPDFKWALLEAADRVGFDGNGKDGLPGYLMWIGKRHPTLFYLDLSRRLILLQEADCDPEPNQVLTELNELIERRAKIAESNSASDQAKSAFSRRAKNTAKSKNNAADEPVCARQQQLNEWFRDELERRKRRQNATQTAKPEEFEWLLGGPNAQESLVAALMRIAVEEPKIFCRMYGAAFLTPPKGWRRRATALALAKIEQ